MTDSERLKKLLEYLGISANKLSKEIGLTTPQVFYDIKSGRCGISKELARRIKEKYLNVDSGWLLTGEGSMIEPEVIVHEAVASPEARESRWATGEVPLVDIGIVGTEPMSDAIRECSCPERYGTGRPGGDHGVMIPFPQSQTGDLAIRQYGDSMAPIIPDGAVLLIRRIDRWKEFIGFGHTFVIILADGRRLTKYIIGYGKDDSYYLAKSFKDEIEDENIPISMIREVWQVVSILALKGW